MMTEFNGKIIIHEPFAQIGKYFDSKQSLIKCCIKAAAVSVEWVVSVCLSVLIFFHVFLYYGVISYFKTFISNKAKGRISKRVFQENESRQIFRTTNISYPLIRTRRSFTLLPKNCLATCWFSVLYSTVIFFYNF